MKKRKPAAVDPRAEHKFLSNYCFAELVGGEQGEHERCPSGLICDCPHHADRVNGVVVECTICRDTGRVWDAAYNRLTEVTCAHDAAQLPLAGVA